MKFINEEELEKIDDHFDNLIKNIQHQKYQEKTEEFKFPLHLLNEIDKNHYRSSIHLTKIERILSHYENYIKQNFTKEDLLKLFKGNQQILHFLLSKNIIETKYFIEEMLHTNSKIEYKKTTFFSI